MSKEKINIQPDENIEQTTAAEHEFDFLIGKSEILYVDDEELFASL